MQPQQRRQRFLILRRPRQHFAKRSDTLFQDCRFVFSRLRNASQDAEQLHRRAGILAQAQLQRLHRQLRATLATVDSRQLRQHLLRLWAWRTDADSPLQMRHRARHVVGIFRHLGNLLVQRQLLTRGWRHLQIRLQHIQQLGLVAQQLQRVRESAQRIPIRRQLCQQAAADPDRHLDAALTVPALVAVDHLLIAQRHHSAQQRQALGAVHGNPNLLPQQFQLPTQVAALLTQLNQDLDRLQIRRSLV